MGPSDELKKHEKLVEKLYDDVVSDSAKVVGKTLSKAVSTALRPLDGAIWSVDKTFDWLTDRLIAYFHGKAISEDEIEHPPLEIERAVITSIQSVGPKEDALLRNMFAGLLANSMIRAREGTHPSFVTILSQLTQEEAKLLCMLTQRPLSMAGGRINAGWSLRTDGGVGTITNAPTFDFTFSPIWLNYDETSVDSDDLENLERLGLIHAEDFRFSNIESIEQIVSRVRNSNPMHQQELRQPVEDLSDFLTKGPSVTSQQAEVKYVVVPHPEKGRVWEGCIEAFYSCDAKFVRLSSWGNRFASACCAHDFAWNGFEKLPDWAS